MDANRLSRLLWMRYEVIHDVVYFSPHVARHCAALGLRGFWMGYFAMRSAPLGRVHPAVVTASFYGFHHSRVARALPEAWARTTPEQAIAAREAAVDEALAEVTTGETDLVRAADLLYAAAEAADTSGRPLAAANQARPRPAAARSALWQATATIREHRGDGHIAVLVSRQITPGEAHRLKVAAGESDGPALKTGRGYPDDEWDSAGTALEERGWLDRSGSLTALGRTEHEAIERATDEVAAQPWRSLGATASEQLLDVLDPIARAVLRTGLIPQPNPVGLLWDVS